MSIKISDLSDNTLARIGLEAHAKAKKSKYHAVPVDWDGIRFDSTAEAAYYGQLRLRLKAGEIAHVDVHPVVSLPGGVRWKLDFLVWPADSSAPYYVDVKGVVTQDFRTKRKLFEGCHPARLLVVKKAGKGWEELT